MASDKQADVSSIVDRILREDLAQYEVPNEIITNIKNKILQQMQRPERKPFGAAVMTASASMAADQARKDKTVQKGGPKPEII